MDDHKASVMTGKSLGVASLVIILLGLLVFGPATNRVINAVLTLPTAVTLTPSPTSDIPWIRIENACIGYCDEDTRARHHEQVCQKIRDSIIDDYGQDEGQRIIDASIAAGGDGCSFILVGGPEGSRQAEQTQKFFNSIAACFNFAGAQGERWCTYQMCLQRTIFQPEATDAEKNEQCWIDSCTEEFSMIDRDQCTAMVQSGQYP